MRLIDADALKFTMLYKENWLRGTGVESPAVWKSDVDDMPTIDAVEVRHGRWVHVATHEMHDKYGGLVGEAYCSECELYSTQLTNIGYVEYDYCPRCGARMDGRREDGDAT